MTWLILSGLLASATAAFGADVPRIATAVMPNPVQDGEAIQFNIEVVSNESPIFDPTFTAPDFTVIGRSNAMTSMAMFDSAQGRASISKRVLFSYVLMTKQPGNFQIRDIKVKVAGREFSTENVRVKVLPFAGRKSAPPSVGADEDEASNPAAPGYQGGQGGQGGQGDYTPPPASMPHSDFSVVAVPSKTRAYVGEPIVIDYFVFDEGEVLQCCEVTRWPTFGEFWKEELQLAMRYEFNEVFVNGKQMRRWFIGRFAIFPRKPGKFTLDRMVVRVKALSQRSFGGGFLAFPSTRTAEHGSQELTIEVHPLPEAGRPDSFGKGVGEFAMKLEADKLTLPQNSPLTLTTTFEGKGNFQAVENVKIPLPDGFERYDEVASPPASVPVGARRELESKKTFQLVTIPRKTGKFEIPAVSWSFFNTRKGAYETLTTKPITVEVTESVAGAAGTNQYVTPSTSGGTATATTPAKQELRYLKAVDLSAPSRSIPWSLVLAGLLLVNVALAMLLLFRKRASLGRFYRTLDPFSDARNQLSAARRSPGTQWQSTLEDALFMMAEVLLESPPRGLTRGEVEELWRSRGLPAPLFQQWQSVLEELNRSRFSATKEATAARDFRERMLAAAETILKEAVRARK